MNAQALKDGLAGFYGTEHWYRHALNPAMTFTDGVSFFAENAGGGAFWFLDIVATEVFPMLTREGFIVVDLTVSGDTAEIIATDGNDNELWTRHISFTDCPEGTWRFFLTNNVLLLPTEH